MYAYMNSNHKLDVDKILSNACVDHWFTQNTEMLFDSSNLDTVVGLLVDRGYKCKVEHLLGGSEQLTITTD